MRIHEQFAKEASTIILTAFLVMEIFPILNISPSLAARLPSSISLAVSVIIIFFSLLGMYGVFKENRIGTYFSILVPLMETILSLSLFTKFIVEGKSSLVATASILPSAVLGIVCVLLASETLSQSELRCTKPSFKAEKPLQADHHAVEVINVTKKYSVGPVVVPAINGLTMKVRRGEFVAVMGPSGCGKSTLLNLIGALDRPTSGRVLIDGTDISTLRGPSQAQLRNQKVGFVFQAYNLINRSNVLRNVELPLLVSDTPREQRLERTGEMLTVVGLEPMSLRKPKTLSGGEQQRVAIARALVNNPKIVLADEPTGNIDSKAGMEILNFLRKTNKKFGTTIIMVTHNREAAEIADRIIYLRDGRIEREEIVRTKPN